MKDAFLEQGEDLDEKLSHLSHELESLRKARASLTSTLVSSKTTAERLKLASYDTTHYKAERIARAEALLEKSERDNLEQLYRLCPGVTAFCAPDPDLHAINGGKLFGIRIDVLLRGKATEPYFLYLKKNKPTGSILALHKHTMPDFLPLKSLMARYMPMSAQKSHPHGHNLQSFVRELRHLLVSFHLRKAAIEKMQKQLEQSEESRSLGQSPTLLHISAANPDMTEIELGWSKGVVGRLQLTQDGVLHACIIQGKSGRIRRAEHSLMRGDRHISELLLKAESISVG